MIIPVRHLRQLRFLNNPHISLMIEFTTFLETKHSFLGIPFATRLDTEDALRLRQFDHVRAPRQDY